MVPLASSEDVQKEASAISCDLSKKTENELSFGKLNGLAYSKSENI